jgi:LysM repeat protein
MEGYEMKRLALITLALIIILTVTSTVAIAAPNKDINCNGSYTIVAGDTLKKIAASCTMTLSDLLALNPQITNPNLIYPGQVITLSGTPATTTTTPVPATTTYTTTYPRSYSWDTLASIAARYNISVDTLLANNPNLLVASGQTLVIPGYSTSSTVGTGELSHGKYSALRGDTLRNLAVKFHFTVESMLKYNPNITNPDANVGGLTIILPSR